MEEEEEEEKQKIEDKMEMLEPTDGGKRREASRHKSMAMGLEMEETVLGYNIPCRHIGRRMQISLP